MWHMYVDAYIFILLQAYIEVCVYVYLSRDRVVWGERG